VNHFFFSLYPDLRQLIYRYGIVGENKEKDWNTMLERYLQEDVATEKTNLLRGLTSTEDIALISRSRLSQARKLNAWYRILTKTSWPHLATSKFYLFPKYIWGKTEHDIDELNNN